MVFVGKTVGIVEMRVDAAKLCRAFVHQYGKICRRSRNRLRQCDRRIVSAFEQQAVEQFAHGQGFSVLQIDRAFAHHAVFGHGDFLIHVQVFQRQQRGHDFCGGSRIDFAIRLLAEQHAPVEGVHRDGAGGIKHIRIQPRRVGGGVVRRGRIGAGLIACRQADLRQQRQDQQKNPRYFQFPSHF